MAGPPVCRESNVASCRECAFRLALRQRPPATGGGEMVDYLIHYFKKGCRPFRSLTTLPEPEALALMRSLYIKDSVFWERFEDPEGYLMLRRAVEERLYGLFAAKGGRPVERKPVYFMLGRPPWASEMVDAVTIATTEEIVVPLSLFDEHDISFTYPDSMVSAIVERDKNPLYYEPEVHGRLFTLPEIRTIVAERGMPGEKWQTQMPRHLAHYIEAQVWNRGPLDRYLAMR